MLGAIIGTVLGGLVQGGAARSAARAQERIGREQIALQRDIYNQQRRDFRPYRRGGRNALAGYLYEMGMGEQPEGYGGFTATPGYEFRLQEGMDAIDGSAAARGGLFSGRTLRALNDYGQGMASQEYGTFMDRTRDLVGIGQASAGQTAAAGANFANGASNALAAIGNARSAGIVGVGNAINDAIGTGLGLWQYQGMLDRMYPQQPAAAGGGWTSPPSARASNAARARSGPGTAWNTAAPPRPAGRPGLASAPVSRTPGATEKSACVTASGATPGGRSPPGASASVRTDRPLAPNGRAWCSIT